MLILNLSIESYIIKNGPVINSVAQQAQQPTINNSGMMMQEPMAANDGFGAFSSF